MTGEEKQSATAGSARGRRGRRSAVTLADVAAEAGVSVGTVSFVLNGRDDMRIAASTAERVREAAHRLNYRPNHAAKALRTGKTGTIALISDQMSSTAFGGAAIGGALDEAKARGKMVFLGETQGVDELETDLIENLLARDVDGFLYAFSVTREVDMPKRLAGVPTVLLNAVPVTQSDVTAVAPDDWEGARAATTSLIESGHRHVTVLMDYRPGIERPRALDLRLDGIRSACLAAGLQPPTVLLGGDPPDVATGRTVMGEFLQTNPVPEALICLNDRLAFGAMQALPPDVVPGRDLSLIGFDNSDLATWVQPPLTSVHLPYYEMGRLAMQLLLDGQLRSGLHRFPMNLVQRDSTRVSH